MSMPRAEPISKGTWHIEVHDLKNRVNAAVQAIALLPEYVSSPLVSEDEMEAASLNRTENDSDLLSSMTIAAIASNPIEPQPTEASSPLQRFFRPHNPDDNLETSLLQLIDSRDSIASFIKTS